MGPLMKFDQNANDILFISFSFFLSLKFVEDFNEETGCHCNLMSRSEFPLVIIRLFIAAIIRFKAKIQKADSKNN